MVLLFVHNIEQKVSIPKGTMTRPGQFAVKATPGPVGPPFHHRSQIPPPLQGPGGTWGLGAADGALLFGGHELQQRRLRQRLHVRRQRRERRLRRERG